jgi:hypothetical protein
MRALTRRSFLAQGAFVGGTGFATMKQRPALPSVLVGQGRIHMIDTVPDLVKDGGVSGLVAMATERDRQIYEGAAGPANQTTHSPWAEDILRPNSVRSTLTNQIGGLNVRERVAVASNWSNSIDQSQDQKQKWGYSLGINQEPVPNGRSAGNMAGQRFLNCSYRGDPAKQVTGATLTRTAPFYDVRVAALLCAFEREIHPGLDAV